MSTADLANVPPDLKSRLIERLHDPVQLRIFTTVAILVVGYLAVCMPLGGKVYEAAGELAAQRQLTELASAVEHLRGELAKYQGRLPKQVDTKEWVEYVLEGIRRFPLRMTQLTCEAPRDIGPYKAVVLRIDLEGDFHDMDGFLRWMESNRRLFRADALRICPSLADRNVLVMQLTVLGVMG
jgi:Tfp pilus assembly protein PilO